MRNIYHLTQQHRRRSVFNKSQVVGYPSKMRTRRKRSLFYSASQQAGGPGSKRPRGTWIRRHQRIPTIMTSEHIGLCLFDENDADSGCSHCIVSAYFWHIDKRPVAVNIPCSNIYLGYCPCDFHAATRYRVHGCEVSWASKLRLCVTHNLYASHALKSI
jgi:hypothetical protein